MRTCSLCFGRQTKCNATLHTPWTFRIRQYCEVYLEIACVSTRACVSVCFVQSPSVKMPSDGRRPPSRAAICALPPPAKNKQTKKSARGLGARRVNLCAYQLEKKNRNKKIQFFGVYLGMRLDVASNVRILEAYQLPVRVMRGLKPAHPLLIQTCDPCFLRPARSFHSFVLFDLHSCTGALPCSSLFRHLEDRAASQKEAGGGGGGSLKVWFHSFFF